MNEFLLIAATDWTELENAPALFITQGVDMYTVQNLADSTEFTQLSANLEEMGFLNSNEQIVDAKFINTESGESNYRFWYRRAE